MELKAHVCTPKKRRKYFFLKSLTQECRIQNIRTYEVWRDIQSFTRALNDIRPSTLLRLLNSSGENCHKSLFESREKNSYLYSFLSIFRTHVNILYVNISKIAFLLLACSPSIHCCSSFFLSSVNGIVIHWESALLSFFFITLPSNHEVLPLQILKHISNISTSVHLKFRNTRPS